MHGREESLNVTLASYGALVFRLEREIPHVVPNTADAAEQINATNEIKSPKGRKQKQCSRKKNV